MPTYRTAVSDIARTPTRAPGLRADNGVPLTSALISGGLIATAAALTIGGPLLYITYRVGGDLWAVGIGVLSGAAVVGTIVATVDWFRQRDRYHETIWARENVTGQDHDGDGIIGRPRAHGMTVNPRGEAQPDPAQVMAEQTAAMLRAIYARKSTTYASVRRLLPDLERDDYDAIRDELIKAGLARWIGNGRSHGWQPTDLPLEKMLAEARKRIVWLAAFPSPTAG